MTRPAYYRVEVCTLARLSVARTGPAEYTIMIHRPPHQPRPKLMTKLRRGAPALLLFSSGIPIESILGTHPPLRPRHAPTGLAPYVWNYQGGGVISSRPLDVEHDQTQQIKILQ